MSRLTRKPRRLPFPRSRPAVPRLMAPREHWLDRFEREQEALDDARRSHAGEEALAVDCERSEINI